MKRFHHLVRYPEVWGLTAAALLTRLWQLAQPNDIVFDEVYFRKFASNYLDGHYFFDIHPPLTKLLFAAVAHLAGLNAAQVVDGDGATFILRLLPAIAGVLLVPLMYIIIRQLGLGRKIAAFGGLLVLLDNALLVESRFVLMDSLLLLFGMGALSCYLVLRKAKGTKRWLWLIAMAVCLGATVSTKWTGLSIVWLLGVAWFVEYLLHKVKWRLMLGEAAAVIAIIAAMYIGCFAAHFALLRHSGDGDAFMSLQFQTTLVGSPYYDKTATMSFWDKIIELNRVMYTSEGSVGGHPYASHWYSWPLMIRPVYYWEGQADKSGVQGNIYLLGNPVVWWGSTASVVIMLLLLVFRRRWLNKRLDITLLLAAGYAINILPFMFIDRSMFLYHYLFALLFAIMLSCVLFSLVLDWQAKRYGHKSAMQVYWSVIFAVFVSFVYFLPISYGWPLSPAQLQQHMWLATWR